MAEETLDVVGTFPLPPADFRSRRAGRRRPRPWQHAGGGGGDAEEQEDQERADGGAEEDGEDGGRVASPVLPEALRVSAPKSAAVSVGGVKPFAGSIPTPYANVAYDESVDYGTELARLNGELHATLMRVFQSQERDKGQVLGEADRLVRELHARLAEYREHAARAELIEVLGNQAKRREATVAQLRQAMQTARAHQHRS